MFIFLQQFWVYFCIIYLQLKFKQMYKENFYFRSKLTFVTKITHPSDFTDSVTLTSHVITNLIISTMSFTLLGTLYAVPSVCTTYVTKTSNVITSFPTFTMSFNDKAHLHILCHNSLSRDYRLYQLYIAIHAVDYNKHCTIHFTSRQVFFSPL